MLVGASSVGAIVGAIVVGIMVVGIIMSSVVVSLSWADAKAIKPSSKRRTFMTAIADS